MNPSSVTPRSPERHAHRASENRASKKRVSARAPRRTIAKLALAVAVLSGAGVAVPMTAQAADNPYERGPAPTESSIEAPRGPFATSDTRVSSLVSGFGGGTIYYPTTTSEGTFGAVVIAPGYTASQSSMAWLGPRLASQGFVVFTIDTNSRFDQPSSRADQIWAALNYLTDRSSVRSRIDASRLAAMGHSMGGGGTIEVADEHPSLQAAIPLTPWHLRKSWSGLTVPTMVVGAENDSIAPVSSHSEPFYTSMTSAQERAYLELNNASHFAPNSSNTTIAKYGISWLKRFVDNDTRYTQFLCPRPQESSISEYRDSCPIG